MAAWLLLLVGIVAVALGLFVGVVSYEVTLALIVIGAIVALIGAYQLVRGRRTV
jgi:membrane associated rhomboid family serine protease